MGAGESDDGISIAHCIVSQSLGDSLSQGMPGAVQPNLCAPRRDAQDLGSLVRIELLKPTQEQHRAVAIWQILQALPDNGLLAMKLEFPIGCFRLAGQITLSAVIRRVKPSIEPGLPTAAPGAQLANRGVSNDSAEPGAQGCPI